MKTSISARTVIPYIILFIALLSGLLVLFPLRNFIEQRLAAFQHNLVETIEKSSGLTLRYARLNPSILLQVEITDLELLRADGSTFFASDHARISYNIFQLLGTQSLDALREIEIKNGRLFIDVVKDAQLFKETETVDKNTGIVWIRNGLDKLSHALPSGLSLAFEKIQLQVQGTDWETSFVIDETRINSSANTLDFSVRLELATKNLPGLGFLGSATGTVTTSGTYYRENGQIQAQLSIGEMKTDLGTLRPQVFAAVLGFDELKLRKIADNQALDMQMDWDLKTDVLNIVAKADHWTGTQAFEPSQNSLPVLKEILETPVDSRVEIKYAIASAKLSYTYDLHATNGKSGDELVLANAKGSLGENGTGQSSISLRGPGFRLNLDGTAYDSKLTASTYCFLSTPFLPVPLEFGAQINAALGGPLFRTMLISAISLKTGNVALSVKPIRISLENKSVIFNINAQIEKNGIFGGTVALNSSSDKKGSQSLLVELSKVKVRESSDLFQNVATFLGFPLGAPLFAAAPEDLELGARIVIDQTSGLRIFVDGLKLRTASLHKDGQYHDVLSSSIRFENQKLEIPDTLIDGGQGIHSLESSAQFDVDGSVTVLARLDKNTPGALVLSGNFGADQTFELHGSHGFHASGNWGVNGVSGSAHIDNVPLSALGASSQLSANVNFDVASLSSWSFRIQSLAIDSVAWNPAFPQKLGHLVVRDGYFLPSSAHIADLRYLDETSTLVGSADLGYTMETLPDFSLSLRLTGQNVTGQPVPSLDQETLTGNAGIKSGHFQGHFVLNNSPLQRIIELGIRGYGMVDVTIGADLAQPAESLTIGGNVEIQKGYLNNDAVYGHSAFSYDRGTLLFKKGVITLQEHQLTIDQLLIGLDEGSIDLQSRYQRNDNPELSGIKIVASARWQPPKDPSENPLFSSFVGNVQLERLKVPDGEPRSYQISIRHSGNAMEFSETRNAAFRGRIQQTGEFLVQLERSLPITGTISGVVHETKIEANIVNLNSDLKTVSALLNTPILSMKEGSVSGTLRIVGDLTDPDFYGSLKAENVRAHFGLTPEDLTAPKVFMIFEEKRMRLLGVTFASANSKTRVEGEFVLSRWNVPSFTLKVDTKEGQGIHIKSDFASLAVDGYGHGNIVVDYSPSQVIIRGQISADDTSLQVQQQDRAQNSRKSTADLDPGVAYVIDLAIKTGKGVEFFYPSKDLPIFHTTFDINQSANFSMNQNAGTWSLVGTLNSRGGDIAYLKRNFLLRQASMVFNENQLHFDPRFNARADTRAIIDDKSTKISLIFENASFSNWKPRIEADVPMTNDQLINIMNGDVSQSSVASDTPSNNNAALANTIGYVGQFAFLNALESKIRNATTLDIFSLRTNLLPNIALNAVANNPLDNQTTSLGKYFDDTTLQIGKFIGTDVYLELLTQLHSVQSYGANANTLGLALDLELNMEWDTPFVNIQWNFAPKNAQDLFLRDNTIQFSWRLQ